MKRKIKFFGLLILISLFISCAFELNKSNEPYKYSSTFSHGGYYICYDGVHYKYACYTSDTVREIIMYYYPDSFEVNVYDPGTAETGYLNTIFYATWKSYLKENAIK